MKEEKDKERESEEDEGKGGEKWKGGYGCGGQDDGRRRGLPGRRWTAEVEEKVKAKEEVEEEEKGTRKIEEEREK